MLDIGIAGLDTSHPPSFAAKIAEHPDARLTAVWDGGDVRDESYARAFAERHDAVLVDALGDMAETVDAAMVLTLDWHTHADLARTFLDVDVPTLIDKPIAGCIDDIEAIADAAAGTPFFGGSAVPFHSSVRSFPAKTNGQLLYAVGYNDPFYYGPHVIDTLRRIVDEDWSVVSPAADPGTSVRIEFADGSPATVRLDGADDSKRFVFLRIGNRPHVVEVGNTEREVADMYAAYLDRFIEVIEEGIDERQRILDAASLLIAVDAVLAYDEEITPESSLLTDHSVDGETFIREYSPYN